MEYINTKEKIVDIFTKALLKDAYEYLRGKLGVMPLSKAMQKIQGVSYIKQANTYIIQIDVVDHILGIA